MRLAPAAVLATFGSCGPL